MGDYSFKRDGVYAKWALSGGNAKQAKPFRCEHVAGLPVAEGAKCSIDMRPDRFVIESAGARFELLKSKVTGIEKMTRTQLEQAVKPNAGMAALGGLGFGVVGAVVGASLGTTKTLKRREHFAVFTYESDGLKCLVFSFRPDDNQLGSAKQTLRKFVKDFEGGEGYGKAATVEL